MPRTTAVRWTHVSRNIYRGPASYRVQWRDHGRSRYEFFPLSTELGVLRRFRDDQEGRSTPTSDRDAGPPGTWAEDVAAWLTTREGRSCYASDRSHVKPWLAAFGPRSRHAITDGDVAKTVALWERDGVKPREIRHRLQVLRSVFKLADPRGATPADYVKVGKVETEDPKLVSAGLIATVAAQLLEQEQKGRLRDGKTRARFLVEATCGQRPVQIMRAQPGDVQLPAADNLLAFGWWQVRRAKGGKPVRLALNPEMVQAWRLFIAADAWGVYDRRSYGKTLRTAGFPADIPPYNLRHSTLQEATNAGGDFGQVSAVAGHMSPETTRRFYVRHSPTAGVAALLSGRFTGASADPFAPSPTHWTKAERKAAREARGRDGKNDVAGPAQGAGLGRLVPRVAPAPRQREGGG